MKETSKTRSFGLAQSFSVSINEVRKKKSTKGCIEVGSECIGERRGIEGSFLFVFSILLEISFIDLFIYILNVFPL